MNSKKLPLMAGIGFFVISAIAVKLIFFGTSLNAKPFVLGSAQKAHYENIFTKEKYELANGEKVEFLKYKEPFVMINFWATWCVPCLKKFKSIKKLQKKFGDKIKVIGVNVDQELSDKKYQAFIKKNKLDFKSIKDPESKILSKFHLAHIPAVILYHKGKVIHFSNDQKSYNHDKIVTQISSLLK